VQSRGGSDTPALPAGTKYVLASEASVICAVTAECGPDGKLCGVICIFVHNLPLELRLYMQL